MAAKLSPGPRRRPIRRAGLGGHAVGMVCVLFAQPCPKARAADDGIHKIKHVVMIMQENRSFDSYFGTFPGADGIPMANDTPAVCVPDPKAQTCVVPYHDAADQNG